MGTMGSVLRVPVLTLLLTLVRAPGQVYSLYWASASHSLKWDNIIHPVFLTNFWKMFYKLWNILGILSPAIRPRVCLWRKSHYLPVIDPNSYSSFKAQIINLPQQHNLPFLSCSAFSVIAEMFRHTSVSFIKVPALKERSLGWRGQAESERVQILGLPCSSCVILEEGTNLFMPPFCHL